jgi:ATP-dependent RNA helicase DDX56/DBP9
MAPDARLLEHATTFSAFSNILDARILRALADMSFARPTLIQARAIPLALDEHRDILARARTGSGKTAAYCLPIIQKILLRKGKGKDKAMVSREFTAFLNLQIHVCNRKIQVVILKIKQKP